jgi:hypothetical protein
MKAYLSQDASAYKLISKGRNPHAQAGNLSLGRDLAGLRMQMETDMLAVGGLTLDESFGAFAFLAQDRHAHLAERGVHCLEGVVNAGRVSLAYLASIVSIARRRSARGSTGGNDQAAGIRQCECGCHQVQRPHEMGFQADPSHFATPP